MKTYKSFEFFRPDNEEGLKITITPNKKMVNFLDITLNLEDGSYEP